MPTEWQFILIQFCVKCYVINNADWSVPEGTQLQPIRDHVLTSYITLHKLGVSSSRRTNTYFISVVMAQITTVHYIRPRLGHISH
jgi:hypothetical protein